MLVIFWRGGMESHWAYICQIDALALKQPGPRTGFFGALDTLEPECVAPLLEAATQWLKLRKVERIRGPWTLNSNGESGIMVEGQDEPP